MNLLQLMRVYGQKRKLSIDRMQPDYLAYYKFGNTTVDLLAVEAKLPGQSGFQVISDRSKGGVECKRIIDNQISFGIRKPMALGVVVEGYTCHTFYCVLDHEAGYSYVEVAKFQLAKDSSCTTLIVSIMQYLLQSKKLMDTVIKQIRNY